MPCRSDYLEPTEIEIEMSRVKALLVELNTGKLPAYYGDVYRASTYNNTGKDELDKATDNLCQRLGARSDEAMKKYSLEMQIWWRDHQAADAKRKRREILDLQTEELRKNALNKLTPKEREILGL